MVPGFHRLDDHNSLLSKRVILIEGDRQTEVRSPNDTRSRETHHISNRPYLGNRISDRYLQDPRKDQNGSHIGNPYKRTTTK